MLYIVFDIEIIFLFAWATRFNDLGWYGILAIITGDITQVDLQNHEMSGLLQASEILSGVFCI